MLSSQFLCIFLSFPVSECIGVLDKLIPLVLFVSPHKLLALLLLRLVVKVGEGGEGKKRLVTLVVVVSSKSGSSRARTGGYIK